MNNTGYYINSKVLIAEIFNDYNIQSSDFIVRFPVWCANCLGYLKIHQAYTESELQDVFFNGLYNLPFYCRSVSDVIINGKKATLKFSIFNNDANIVQDFALGRTPYIDEPKPQPITPINTEVNTQDYPEYWIENNWIHSNVDNGDIVVRFKSIPTIYDSETNMVFPLIYNDEMLKLAIKLYVVNMMLNRGYIHPIQNLKENNPFTNPALRLEQIRYKVRTSCNKFNKDRRINLVDINTEIQ